MGQNLSYRELTSKTHTKSPVAHSCIDFWHRKSQNHKKIKSTSRMSKLCDYFQKYFETKSGCETPHLQQGHLRSLMVNSNIDLIFGVSTNVVTRLDMLVFSWYSSFSPPSLMTGVEVNILASHHCSQGSIPSIDIWDGLRLQSWISVFSAGTHTAKP